jgi:hypothetical protein
VKKKRVEEKRRKPMNEKKTNDNCHVVDCYANYAFLQAQAANE